MNLRRCLSLLLSLAFILLSCGFSPAEGEELPVGYSFSRASLQPYSTSTVYPVELVIYTGLDDSGRVVSYPFTDSDIGQVRRFGGYIDTLSIPAGTYSNFSFRFDCPATWFNATIDRYYINAEDLQGFWRTIEIVPEVRRAQNQAYISFDLDCPNGLQSLSLVVVYTGTLNRTSISFQDLTLEIISPDEKGFLAGFFDSILGGITRIFSSIVSLPSEIASSIKGFFTDLGNVVTSALSDLGDFLLDGLKSLFIPEDGYFGDLLDRLNTFFSDRFGFLYFPIEHLISLTARFLALQDPAPSITFPELGWDGEVIIPETIYTFDFLDEEPWSTVHEYYLMAMDVALIMAFVKLLLRKYEEVISGNGA